MTSCQEILLLRIRGIFDGAVALISESCTSPASNWSSLLINDWSKNWLIDWLIDWSDWFLWFLMFSYKRDTSREWLSIWEWRIIMQGSCSTCFPCKISSSKRIWAVWMKNCAILKVSVYWRENKSFDTQIETGKTLWNHFNQSYPSCHLILVKLIPSTTRI